MTELQGEFSNRNAFVTNRRGMEPQVARPARQTPKA